MTHENKTTGRLFQATRHALNLVSFRTNQYKQVVQKKIDLGAIHKTIEQLQAELGKQIDDLYRAEKKQFLKDREVAHLLEKLFSLNQAADLLEEEIELIRTELPAAAEAPDTDSAQEKN